MSDSHPPLGGIHEAALYARDLDAAERFWRSLGFALIARAARSHLFLRAGRDVLLVFHPAATLRPGRDIPSHGALGPGHVAFDVPDTDALRAWEDRLAAIGVPVEHRQTWPAGARSIYFRDPAGNSIELIVRGAWGA